MHSTSLQIHGLNTLGTQDLAIFQVKNFMNYNPINDWKTQIHPQERLTSRCISMTDRNTLSPSQIVMYATEYCSDCLRAKSFFEKNEIQHLRVGLEGDDEATRFVIQINNGYRSVPTIIFPDGSILVEPSWEALRAKFVHP